MEGGLPASSQKRRDFFPVASLNLLGGAKTSSADSLTHQILVATGKGEGGEITLQRSRRDGGSAPSLPPSLPG
jgi:hypothetical protein